MPDLLAHALFAYALGTALSWRYEWLAPHWVTVAIVGAFVPDLVKVRLLVPDSLVTEVLGGSPFSWGALHTGGPVLLSVLIGVLAVAPRHSRRAFALLSVGAASHLLADALLANPSGRSFALVWPLTRYHPPTPGLYHSTDPWPTVATLALAALVWAIDARLVSPSRAPPESDTRP